MSVGPPVKQYHVYHHLVNFNESFTNDNKLYDGEAPVLEIWGMWSTPLLMCEKIKSILRDPANCIFLVRISLPNLSLSLSNLGYLI